jgi:hypothetical protein
VSTAQNLAKLGVYRHDTERNGARARVSFSSTSAYLVKDHFQLTAISYGQKSVITHPTRSPMGTECIADGKTTHLHRHTKPAETELIMDGDSATRTRGWDGVSCVTDGCDAGQEFRKL